MDFFIRTYRSDAQWLSLLLRSIKKFCNGYHEFVMVCPNQDSDIIQSALRCFPLTPIRLETTDENPSMGYLEQQYSKMMADQYCSGDYIGFIDSDCMFIKHNTPETWFVDGKIRYLITPYEALGNTVNWRPITEDVLGFSCPFETMRRHPCVFPREVIEHCRAYISFLHRRPFKDVVMSYYGHAFSEFNVMGSYARELEPKPFSFIDTTKNDLPEKVLEQRWSYGGITPQIQEESERILS